MTLSVLQILKLKVPKGGQGSGNFGHGGRPGQVGGSGEGGENSGDDKFNIKGGPIETNVKTLLNKETWKYELSSYDSSKEAIASLWNFQLDMADGHLTNDACVYSPGRDFVKELQDILPDGEKETNYGSRTIKTYHRKADHIWNFYIVDITKEINNQSEE